MYVLFKTLLEKYLVVFWGGFRCTKEVVTFQFHSVVSGLWVQ